MDKLKPSDKVLTLLDQAVWSGSNFLLNLLLAKELELLEYGVFAWWALLILALNAIQQSLIVVPMLNLAKEKKNKTYWASMGQLNILLSMGSIAGLAILNGSIGWIDQYQIFAGYALMILLMDFQRKRFHALGKSISALVISVLAAGFILFLPFIQITDAASLVQLQSIYLSLFLVPLAVLDVAKGVSLTTLIRICKNHWSYAKWLLATAGLQWSSGNYFLIVADRLLGHEILGIVRIGQTFMGFLSVFFQALENYVPVRASAILEESGLQAWKGFMKAVSWKGAVICISIISVLLITLNPLLEFFEKAAIVEEKWFIEAYLVLGFVIFLSYPIRLSILSLGKASHIFWAYLLNAAFAMATAQYLIMQMGLLGLLIGLFSSQVILLATYTIGFTKTLGNYENYTLYTR